MSEPLLAAPDRGDLTMTKMTTDVPARTLPEPLLRVEDLERLLRVDARTIRRLWQRGQLPRPMKLGGQNRWRVEDITDALEVLRQPRCEPCPD
jgi:predicted DNA-binding transcriptional regulator AlpA